MTKQARKAILAAVTAMGALTMTGNAALTGWWEFNGDLSDSSGNGHTATAHGDATIGAGLFGGGLVLDGDGDWADVASHADHQFPQGTDFSISLFYNGPDSDINNGLITKGYANNPRDPGGYYLLQVTNPDQIEFDSRSGAGATPRFRTGLIGPDITDGAWHNITLVRDYTANQFRSYVDGNLVHTATLNATDGGDWGMGVNSEALTFGDHLDRFTAGSFDDIAIWKDQVLSPAEITLISNSGVAALIPEPGSAALLGLPGLLALGRRRR